MFTTNLNKDPANKKGKYKLPLLEIGVNKSYDIRCKTLIKSTDLFNIYEAFFVTKKAEIQVYLIQINFLDSSQAIHLQRRIELLYKALEIDSFRFDKLFAKRIGYFIKDDENSIFFIYDKASMTLLNRKSFNVSLLMEPAKVKDKEKEKEKDGKPISTLLRLQLLCEFSFYCKYLHSKSKKLCLIHPDLLLFNTGNDCFYYFDYIYDELFKDYSKADNFNISSNIGYFDLEEIENIDNNLNQSQLNTQNQYENDSTYQLNQENNKIGKVNEQVNEPKEDEKSNQDSESESDGEERTKRIVKIENQSLLKQLSKVTSIDNIYLKTDILLLSCFTVWLFSKKSKGDKEIISFDEILNNIKMDFLLQNSSFSNLLSYVDSKEYPFVKGLILEVISLDYKKINNISSFIDKIMIILNNEIQNKQCVKCEKKDSPKKNNDNILLNSKSQVVLNKENNNSTIYVNNEIQKLKYHMSNKSINYISKEVVCSNCINTYISSKSKLFKESLSDKYLKYQDQYMKIKSIFNSVLHINQKEVKKYFDDNILPSLSNITDILNNTIFDIGSNNNKVNSLIEYHENLIMKLIQSKENELYLSLNSYNKELEVFAKVITENKKNENSNLKLKDETSIYELVNNSPYKRIFLLNEYNNQNDKQSLLKSESIKGELYSLMSKKEDYLIYEKECKEKFNTYYDCIKQYNLLKVSLNFEKDLKIALEKLKNECISFSTGIKSTMSEFDLILNDYRVESPYITEKNLTNTTILENINIENIFPKRIAAFSSYDRILYVFDSSEKTLMKPVVSKIKGYSGGIHGCRYLNINGKLVVTGGIYENPFGNKINNTLYSSPVKSKESKSQGEGELLTEKYIRYNNTARFINIPNNFHDLYQLDINSKFSYNILDLSFMININDIKKGDLSCNSELLPPMKNPRFHHSTAKITDYSFIVVGGEENSTCEEYSFLLNKWIDKPSLPISIYNSSLIIINSVDLYLFFGLIGSGTEKGKPSLSIMKLSLYANTPEWKKILFEKSSTLQLDRCFTGLFQIEDEKIIILGGNYKNSTSNRGEYILKYDIKKKYLSSISNDNYDEIGDYFYDEGGLSRVNDNDLLCFSADFNIVSFSIDEFLS